MLCGEHLLKMRTPTPGAWRHVAPLVGFSHGASGIGLALLRLHAAAPDRRFAGAAMEGFAYEQALLSPELSNWAHLHEEGTRVTKASWCHGASGVVLARLASLSLAGKEEDVALLRSDIESGLRQMADAAGNASDGSLCCGEMGRVETLLCAGRRLGRPELEDQTRHRASGVAAGLCLPGTRPFLPGFFQGSAGIGYGLLRLAAPSRLPSILLWE